MSREFLLYLCENPGHTSNFN